MQRLLTAAALTPLALVAVFLLPARWFFLLILGLMECGVLEYVRLTRRWAPHAPLRSLVVLVPTAAVALTPELLGEREYGWTLEHLLVAGLLTVGVAVLVLLARTPVPEAVGGVGILAFGLPYFVLPLISLYQLRRLDDWVLFLLLAVVWLGDTAAYYVGSRWGRLPLAPTISPKKTWEGAAAGLLASLIATAVWSQWRLGEVSGALLLVGGLTAVAAQLGDLVESMLKRAAEVKDSGRLFPGHGGVLDRLDALLLAAPVQLLSLWLVGYGLTAP